MTAMDWLVLSLLWGASISRIRPARHSLEHRVLWGAFTGLALSRVFTAAPVVTWMDTTTGTELATLLRHLTGLTSATCLLAYVEAITRHGRPSWARWIWPTAAVVMTILVAMFAARGGRIYWIDGAHAPFPTAPSGRVYLAVFDAWLMTCLTAAGWMFARYARVAPPLLRLGLVLSTIGMVAGVINRAHVMTVNMVTLLDSGTSLRETPILGRVTLLVCIIGITAGTSIPAWRTGMARLRDMATLRELRPLWKALVIQYPDLSLPMEIPMRGRVVRRVLEIRDGMLNLTTVSEPPPSDDPGVVAEWVADTLAAARTGCEPGVPSGTIPGPDFAGDMQRETKWLGQVATKFNQLDSGRRSVSLDS
ncbi:MAB_1171c family putative transporter [Streptosporangium sp. NPDC020072]|uniref:MAB_1171c family putative transporter n=1 Tax=Streptosporangium sp. NPDC020072 TaxID=3154788 RepID=UPI003440BC1A